MYTDSILGTLPGGGALNENDLRELVFGGAAEGEENMSATLAFFDVDLEELALEDVALEKDGLDDVNNEVEDCEAV